MDYLINHFPELSTNQIENLLRYQKLIVRWNDKVNLVSRKDIANFIHRHVAPCLCINRVVTFSSNSTVIDIGTGGGLPGIPLAITNPHVEFCLVDSIGKKITAVRDMIKQLNLSNINTQNIRAEQINRHFDYIIARAVTNLPNFLKEVSGLIDKNTKICYLKGGNFIEELKNISHYYIHNIGDILNDHNLSDKVILEIF